MTALEERKTLIGLISEATLAGARQAPACGILGLSERTVQRWLCGEPDAVDGRSSRCYEPSHKLCADERAELLAVANSAEFGHLPPSQIVPRLADQQRYIASESSFYRILREERQLALQTTCSRGRRAKPALQLGYHLFAVSDSRTVLLSLSVYGRIQPDDRRLAGLCRGERCPGERSPQGSLRA